MRALATLPLLLCLSVPAWAETITLSPVMAREEKSVFATVESVKEVAARARLGGIVADISVTEGDKVSAGQRIALIADAALAAQLTGLEARLNGLESARKQADADLGRARELFAQGSLPKARLDQAQTAADVAAKSYDAAAAERAALAQRLADGAVDAPGDGRVLNVMTVAGAVIMAGEPIATIAAERNILRLSVPESLAGQIKLGGALRLADQETAGRITKLYPRIEQGRITADAEVAGLENAPVGQRLRVRLELGERQTLAVPERFIVTRGGVDLVKLIGADGKPVEIPVRRGESLALNAMPDAVEILAGLRAGDQVEAP